MDTQLNALATLAVRARTVSGCLNSAFLGLERNRSAMGKTKVPLVAGGPQQLTPPTPQRRLSPGLESWRAGRWVETESTSLEGRNSCHGRGSTGKPARSLVKAFASGWGCGRWAARQRQSPACRTGRFTVSRCPVWRRVHRPAMRFGEVPPRCWLRPWSAASRSSHFGRQP